MAIAFRASTGASVDPGATSISLSNPTGTANNDVLVVAVAQRTADTPTITAGAEWAQINETTKDGEAVLSLWWRRWQTGDPTSHTFTSTSSAQWAGAIAAYSGVHTTSAIHTHSITVEGAVGSTEHSSPAITTTVDTWLLNIFSDIGGTWTPPTGETEREDRRVSGRISVELCDSNADRASGTQGAKTATSNTSTSQAVMAQLALEPTPTGNGTREAKARIFRSTQTSPNSGTIRDLTTAFGNAANTTTTAAYATGGTTTWRRWNPHSSTTTAVDPAGVNTASGQGWRDTVAENADESVIYNSGIWAVRTRVSKSGQAVVTDIVVRVVAIVYRVSSSGTHLAEIGRVQMADTTIATATRTITGSFTTTADTTFASGDKVQVECYVTPITAGLPTAPGAAVNVHYVVDEASGSDGARLTAIPAFRIAYVRSHAVTTAPTSAMARRISAFRSFATTTTGTTASTRQVVPLPKAVTTVGTTASVRAVTLGAKAVTTTGTTSVTRAVTLGAMAVTTTGSAAMARTITAARSFANTATGVAGFARALIFGRHFTTTTTPTTFGRVDMPIDALNRIVATTPDWPLNTPTKAIAGVTRDSVGGIVGSATVKLIRQSDDVRVATATSNAATGAYSFTRGGDDPYSYYVLAYKEDTPEVHGVTDRGLVPA